MSSHPDTEDLLGLLDGELPEPRSTEVERHLEACPPCLARRQALADASSRAAALWPASSARFAESAQLRDRLCGTIAASLERRRARWAPLAFALTAALLFLVARHEFALMRRAIQVNALQLRALPLASFTPGAARDVSMTEVCGGGRHSAPPIPEVVRLQVLRDYGMEHVPEEDYELDYLITPELGGIPDRRNLWPELYGSRSWNAHVKDALEHVLPQLVCTGRIDLATARHDMASNWIEAYKKYLETETPVQLHARVLIPTEPGRDW